MLKLRNVNVFFEKYLFNFNLMPATCFKNVWTGAFLPLCCISSFKKKIQCVYELWRPAALVLKAYQKRKRS